MHKVVIPDDVYATLRHHAKAQERTTQGHVAFILRAWAVSNPIPVATTPVAPTKPAYGIQRNQTPSGISKLGGNT